MSRTRNAKKAAAFILFGARGSTNTDRVRFTLAEGGITNYQTVLLDLSKGEHKSPTNVARHPFGKVPSIEFPDGFTLYESRSICRYLTSLYAIPLMPPASDIKALAAFDQAISIESLYFQESAGKIAFENIAKKMIGIPIDEKILQSAVKSVESFFLIMDPILQKQAYMAGNDFTLVDIFYIPLMVRLFACEFGYLVTNRNSIDAWWKTLLHEACS